MRKNDFLGKLCQNVGKIRQKMRSWGKLMKSGHNWSKNSQQTLKLDCQIDIEKLQKQIKRSQIVCQKLSKWMSKVAEINKKEVCQKVVKIDFKSD